MEECVEECVVRFIQDTYDELGDEGTQELISTVYLGTELTGIFNYILYGETDRKKESSKINNGGMLRDGKTSERGKEDRFLLSDSGVTSSGEKGKGEGSQSRFSRTESRVGNPFAHQNTHLATSRRDEYEKAMTSARLRSKESLVDYLASLEKFQELSGNSMNR